MAPVLRPLIFERTYINKDTGKLSTSWWGYLGKLNKRKQFTPPVELHGPWQFLSDMQYTGVDDDVHNMIFEADVVEVNRTIGYTLFDQGKTIASRIAVAGDLYRVIWKDNGYKLTGLNNHRIIPLPTGGSLLKINNYDEKVSSKKKARS